MRAAPCRLSLLVLLISVFLPSAALAHSNAVTTDPSDGAHLKALPRTATVTFNEPVSEAAFALRPPAGRVVTVRATVDGSTATAHLPKQATKGAYTLAYRVVSADGHPVTGELSFTVSTGQAPAVTTSAAPADATQSNLSAWWVVGSAVVLLGLALALIRAARR